MMRLDKFLDPGERSVSVIRRHPFAFVSSIVILVVGALLPLLLFLFTRLVVTIDFSSQAMEWIVAGLGVYYLFLLTLGLVLWMDYYYDLYVLTTTHILDVNQTSLLLRDVGHISLVRVQDVTTRVKGFWANLLDFGSVTVQTAGHEENIFLEDIPHPHEAAAKIMRLHDELIAREQRRPEVGEGEGVHPPTSK